MNFALIVMKIALATLAGISTVMLFGNMLKPLNGLIFTSAVCVYFIFLNVYILLQSMH